MGDDGGVGRGGVERANIAQWPIANFNDLKGTTVSKSSTLFDKAVVEGGLYRSNRWLTCAFQPFQPRIAKESRVVI